MILDTSAIVAILQGEPEAEEFALIVESVDQVHVSAATVLEASIVLGRSRQRLLDDFLAATAAVVVSVDEAQVRIARRAHVRYGRQSGSAAKLNYGDCFVYALATSTGAPLLYKGNDFGHTDVRSAAGASTP